MSDTSASTRSKLSIDSVLKYKLFVLPIAGLSIGIIGTLMLLGSFSQSSELDHLTKMQQQVALLQVQNNAGTSNVASIQSQLAGLQTQLVVLQNQLGQLHQVSTQPRVTVLSEPITTKTNGDSQQIHTHRSQTPVVSAKNRNSTNLSSIGDTQSTSQMSMLINNGLKGQKKSENSIYQQIMYSALDINSAYAVSLAAWGPNPSPIAEVLVR
ncbi:hypothetical protein TRICHSKD4_1550 [Roseibium sp. TrichSKD4]|nr:hypothetical protein TRICHSKD4_1550 [Roseibium sp. TrichSKD4]